MKKTTLLFAFVTLYFLLLTAYSFSQGTAINTTGTAADNSALLDLSSTSKGLLIPRMTTTERNLIVSPANGLLIFNTTTNCFEAYVSNAWHSATCPNICIPPASPGAITGNTSVCENAAGQVYSVSVVNGATSYTWSVPAGASVTSGQGTNSVTVTFASTSGNVSVMAGNSCGFSTPATSAVTVIPYAPASVSISANPSGSICAGINVGFTATATNGGTSPSYQWKINGGNVGTNSSTYSNSSLSNGDQVSCVMTSNAMCVSGSPATSNTITMTVTTVPSAPTAGTHVPGVAQIEWKWNTSAGATGYKWNTTNDYNTAQNMLTATSKTELSLTCNTAYTRYVWAYNSCGPSGVTTLSQTTSACPIWTQYVSGTWTIGASNNMSSVTYHGVVNTNQLVMSHVYSKVSTDNVYYIRGVVLDLTTGTFNVGAEYTWGVKPTDYVYRAGVAGDGQYGVTISNTNGGIVELRGFTVTNYSSCNQTTAPTYSFAGQIQHFGNNNNGAGTGCDIVSARANNRYVACTRASYDRQELRSYTYNGSTITAEGAVNEFSNSNGIAVSMDYFANPGSSLNWGVHTSNSDHNGNSVIVSKAGSGGYDASDGAFFPVGKSSVYWMSAKFNDVANNCKSVVVGGNINDSYVTARIVTTTDFTSGAVSMGTAYTSSANFGMLEVLPYTGSKVFHFTTSGVDFVARGISISGTTLTWGIPETLSSNNECNNFWGGVCFTYYNGPDTWFIFGASNNSSAKIIAAKYTP